VVGAECERLQGSPSRTLDAAVGHRSVIDGPNRGNSSLAGLWSRQSRGFYHDGRFQTLDDVINHYDQHMNLGLTNGEKKDLVEFLRSL
jgi:hypothetical protein